MNRKIKFILTGSILFNILLLAILVSFGYQSHYHNRSHDNLDPKSQHIIARNFQNVRKEMQPVFTKMKSKRKELEKIIAAKDFDLEAYEKTSKEISSLRQKMREKKIQTMGETLSDLTLEERKNLSKHIARKHDRRLKKYGSQKGQ